LLYPDPALAADPARGRPSRLVITSWFSTCGGARLEIAVEVEGVGECMFVVLGVVLGADAGVDAGVDAADADANIESSSAIPLPLLVGEVGDLGTASFACGSAPPPPPPKAANSDATVIVELGLVVDVGRAPADAGGTVVALRAGVVGVTAEDDVLRIRANSWSSSVALPVGKALSLSPAVGALGALEVGLTSA
jgi:hypothetical protein